MKVGVETIGAEMKALSKMSTEELWALHEQVVLRLSAKIKEEMSSLDKRLRELRSPMAVAAKRVYPPVLPKYRNPAEPSETWAGRGKKPRWVAAALKKGKSLEDFRIVV